MPRRLASHIVAISEAGAKLAGDADHVSAVVLMQAFTLWAVSNEAGQVRLQSGPRHEFLEKIIKEDYEIPFSAC